MSKFKTLKSKLTTSRFWKTLFKNSFWAFLGDSVASAINLIISIVTIKLIGTDEYGQFVLAQTYMLIMDVILNIQSWQGIIYYGQQALSKHQTNRLHGIIKLGTLIDLSTAIIGGIISILLTSLIGKFLGWNQVTINCATIFSYTIFSHFSGTPTGVLRLLNKFNLVALQKFLSAFIKLISLCSIFFGANYKLETVTFVYVIGDVIGNLLLVVFAAYVYSRKYPLHQIVHAKLPKETPSFIKYTLWSTLNSIVDLPISYLDIFIVSILGDAKVAIYKVFKQIISIIQKTTSPIQQASLPQFSELSSQNRSDYGFVVVRKIKNFILKTFTPIIIIVGATSPFWLNLFYGSEYSHYWYLLFLFLIIQLLALSYTTIHPYFLALGKARESTLYILIANITYLIASCILVHCLGLLGMVLAFGIQVFLAIYLKYRNITHHLTNYSGEISS